jgi:transposase
MAHSEDLRRRVVKYIRQGGSKAEAARIFGINRGCVYVWFRMEKEGRGRRKPGPRGARKVDMQKLSALTRQRNDLMLKEMAQIFDVHESTICKALKRIGMSRKKNGDLRRSQAL